MFAAMADHRTRKRQLADMLAETLRMRRAEEKAIETSQRDWLLQGHDLHVAMAVYMRTECDLEATAMYLEPLAKREKWSARPEDDIHRTIWDAFAAADDALLVALLEDGAGPDYLKARRDAVRHILMWRTRAWNADENRKGHLPSTAQLLGHYERERLTIPFDLRPAPYSSKNAGGLRKQGTRLRSQIGARLIRQPIIDALPPEVLRSKVTAVLQWHNHLCMSVPHTKRIVRINWDETAVCLFPGAVKGSLVIRKEEFPPKSVPKAAKRTYFTHVALISDDDEIQQLLPQVIIGNEHTIKAAELEELRSKCPSNVKILRCNSHWCTGRVCAQIVRMIAAALAAHLEYIQVLLLFDCHSSHLHDLMWRACLIAMFWPLLIPALTTKYLQPLDTHGFAIYKVRLQRAYHDAGIHGDGPDVNFAALLDSLLVTIRDVIFGRSWSNAFSSNGFSLGQKGMQPAKFAKLAFAGPTTFAATRPSDEEVLTCFPKATTFNVARVWRGVDKVEHKVGDIPKLMYDITAVPKAAPIAMRTRAKAKAAMLASGSSSSK